MRNTKGRGGRGKNQNWESSKWKSFEWKKKLSRRKGPRESEREMEWEKKFGENQKRNSSTHSRVKKKGEAGKKDRKKLLPVKILPNFHLFPLFLLPFSISNEKNSLNSFPTTLNLRQKVNSRKSIFSFSLSLTLSLCLVFHHFDFFPRRRDRFLFYLSFQRFTFATFSQFCTSFYEALVVFDAPPQ